MSTIVRAKVKCRVCGHLVNVKSVEGEVATLVVHHASCSGRCPHNRAPLQDVRDWIASRIRSKKESIAEMPRMKAAEEERHQREIKEIDAMESELTKEHAALERLAAKYR